MIGLKSSNVEVVYRAGWAALSLMRSFLQIALILSSSSFTCQSTVSRQSVRGALLQNYLERVL